VQPKAGHWVNRIALRLTLSALFGLLEERFSPYKEVQFRKFCLPVKTTCFPAENVNEIPARVKKNFHSLYM